jgi:hypothetical protein
VCGEIIRVQLAEPDSYVYGHLKRRPDCSEGTMTGVLYLVMLVEFLVLILEEMGPDAMLRLFISTGK